MADRKKIYERFIKAGIDSIKSFQETKKDSSDYGCFFYPKLNGDANHANARWQEAVLSLAYEYRRSRAWGNRERIKAGIDYWCGIQHRNGSLPEYSSCDNSFAATAFSLYAVCEAARIVGIEKRWLEHFEKAGFWLARNDETILINQEAAAALALQALCSVSGKQEFLDAANRKIEKVLSSQPEEGYYPEKKGADIGYSSLTVELLSRYYDISRDKRIIDSANKYFGSCQKQGVQGTRKTGWMIIGGFEYFSHLSPTAAKALKWFIENKNIIHLPDDRHLCTDLYRLYWALINCNYRVKSEKITAFRDISIMHPAPKLPFLRWIGMHKIRRIFYLLR